MRHKAMYATALAVCVTGVAACGGGSSTGGGSAASSSSSAAKATSSGGSAAVVKLSKSGLGRILTDGTGRTLYLFEKDTGPKSMCGSACAKFWPPLVTSGMPKGGAGLAATKLGTTSRGGGVQQVTFAGHPLYYFVKDTAAGETHGEGLKKFGAEWYVLSGSGRKVEEEGS